MRMNPDSGQYEFVLFGELNAAIKEPGPGRCQ